MLPFVLGALAGALIVVDALVGRGRGRYDWADTATNLAIASGGLLTGAAGRFVAIAASWWVYEFRIFDVPSVWWAWALLVVAEDLCFYAFHRASHTVPLLWAAHVPHHSSERFNLTTALRGSWTTPLTGVLFWLPLSWLGFHPAMVLSAHAISLGYQFLVHTQAVGRLGALEWVFNTPSHHRVHHARNPGYLDRNFGGIFIVWDRLFGTFAAEVQTPVYGTVHPVRSHNPLVVQTVGWRRLLQALRDPSEPLRSRLRALLVRPRANKADRQRVATTRWDGALPPVSSKPCASKRGGTLPGTPTGVSKPRPVAPSSVACAAVAPRPRTSPTASPSEGTSRVPARARSASPSGGRSLPATATRCAA